MGSDWGELIKNCLPIKGQVWFLSGTQFCSLAICVAGQFRLLFCRNLGSSFVPAGSWSRISQEVYYQENVSLKETTVFFKFPEMTSLMIIYSPLKLTGFLLHNRSVALYLIFKLSSWKHWILMATSQDPQKVVVQSLSRVWLCHSTDCSTPGFPVLHYLPEFAQTHAHWVYDAIQPSHPLSPPSPAALNLSQYQGLFQWVGYLHQVAKVLERQASASVLPMNIQSWSPCCPRDS